MDDENIDLMINRCSYYNAYMHYKNYKLNSSRPYYASIEQIITSARDYYCLYRNTNCLKYAFLGACRSGTLELVKDMIENIKNVEFDFTSGAYEGYKSKNIDIVNMLIDLGANTKILNVYINT